MQAHIRSAIVGIKKLDPKIEVKVLSQKKHIPIVVSLDKRTKKLILSCSPKNEHHMVLNAVSEVRKFLLSGEEEKGLNANLSEVY